MSDGTSHIEHRDAEVVEDFHIGISRLQTKNHDMSIGVSQVLFFIDFKLKFNKLLEKVAALDSGKNVLIYCEQGCHRSSFLGAAVVMASARCSVDDALQFIKRMRPCVDFGRNKDTNHFCGRDALMVLSEIIWPLGAKVWPLAAALPRSLTEELWRDAFAQARRQPQD